MDGWLRRIFGGTSGQRDRRIEPDIRAPSLAPAAPLAEKVPTPTLPPAVATPSVPKLEPSVWFSQLSGNVLFFDVETTGLHSADRIVSLGMLLLKPSECHGSELAFSALHLVFDPGRKSHPRAEEVHGYDDWALRHQASFRESADMVRALVEQSSLLVAHNFAFDIAFLDREFAAVGLQLPSPPAYCTMQAWRQEMSGSAGLGAITERLGVSRAGSKHCAMEDAWFAFLVWANLNHAFPPKAFPFDHLRRPTNFCDPPPRPDGPLPRRRRLKAEG